MNLFTTKGWEDYELIDSGNAQRFERFGKYKLVRPDPQAIWRPKLQNWNPDAIFENDKWSGNISDKWIVKWKNLSFFAKLSPFKHTGIFPEQSLHWEFIENKIKDSKRQLNILNLFAYTGASSLVAASLGAKVTHLDASRPTIGWAKENQELSKLSGKVRWILDDAIKFTAREVKRGNIYDGIIMDPPAYGHGPEGEVWDFNKSLPILLNNCSQLLSPNPSFVIVNGYAISISSETLKNLFLDFFPKMNIESGELGIEEKSGNRILSTGIFARAF